MTAFRLPEGGAVDRGRKFAFTFDGRPFLGLKGDSIASALLASGVRIVGRSFKYHRPRGIWGSWTEEPNAIVDVTRCGRTTPNLRATTEALENDLFVRSVNARPTAGEDRAAPLDAFSAFMPSGFYYKTFLWPRWETFEPAVRAMAGLGRIDPNNRPPADNLQFNVRCDLLVVGAGAAGLAAANAAARLGQVVFLLDDRPDVGGQLIHRGGEIEGGDWREWAESVKAAVEAGGGRVMTSTTAFGIYDHNLVCAWERAQNLARCALAHPAEAHRRSGGRDRAPARHPRQRSPWRDVRRRRARLSSPVRGAGRQARRHRNQQRQRLSGRRGA